MERPPAPPIRPSGHRGRKRPGEARSRRYAYDAFAGCFTLFALADVATGATFAVFVGLPLLIIVAAVVVVSIAAKAIRSRKKDRDDK